MDEKKKDPKERPDEGQPQKEEGRKKEGDNKFLFIGIIVGVLLVNMAIAFVLIQVTKPHNPAEDQAKLQADSVKQAGESESTMGATTAEKPIEVVVNIAGTDGERFLKASVIFEWDEVQYPELGVELEKREPKNKDLVLDLLSKLTLTELTEPEAKDKIRKDLLRLINNSLSPKIGEIREVYFTQYIIQ